MCDFDLSTLNAGAPWHRESFGTFISEDLPTLLTERLPLTGYKTAWVVNQVQNDKGSDQHTCRVDVGVGGVEVSYIIPSPNEEGLFHIDDGLHVVVPVASDENLDTATVRCVGEQLHDYVAERLGKASGDLPWDETLVRAWLPLDQWVRNVVTSRSGDDSLRWATGQWLDGTNGLAARSHLRRIMIPGAEKPIAPGQFGRVCPFETPEGPNIGRIFSIAVGATIRNGRIEIVDDRPEAALGLTASMVPFLEHNDANRQLFAVNMMRQWLIPETPEPALVQTGNEPAGEGVWCGRNLLTAFISQGYETFEDAILISESGAKRLDVRPGDKISNRHGTKGVIGRVVPDDEMPKLADGTPVELVCSSIALHTRLNFGQIREALMSRIARAEGEPAIVPPFHAPTDDEIRERLRKAGLLENGMEHLTVQGKTLDYPSVAGWVYWGLTNHKAEYKVHAGVISDCNRQGQLEYQALRDMGCFANIASYFNTCSGEREDAEEFAEAVESGPVAQRGAPSPRMARLIERLAAAGIRAELNANGLSFALASPDGGLKLARPLAHPWLPGHAISEVGVFPDMPHYGPMVEASAALQRAIDSGAPASLADTAAASLQARLDEYLNAMLVPPADLYRRDWQAAELRFGNRVMFSGRTVLAPGWDLRLDQIGLAEKIAWTMFGPLVIREIGDRAQVENRTEAAARALDEIMARSWVILTRAPVLTPTGLIAFHPVRIPDDVIRIHPAVAFLMNGDFDGDQAAVFLPITEDAQREAGEKLSLTGHLRRDPNLYGLRLITQEAVWGLARLSLTSDGLKEVNRAAGTGIAMRSGIIDKDSLADALREIMARDGVDGVIQAIERLFELGLRAAKESGASIDPFIGRGLALPPVPDGTDPTQWDAYCENVDDLLVSRSDYGSVHIGPQLLSIKSGARGSVRHLARLFSGKLVTDAAGRPVPVTHGLREGVTPEEMFACVAGAREGLASINYEMTRNPYGVAAAGPPKGFGVLARAMRATNPGPVFARAAAAGEVDPLTDLDSRLFAGLPPDDAP